MTNADDGPVGDPRLRLADLQRIAPDLEAGRLTVRQARARLRAVAGQRPWPTGDRALDRDVAEAARLVEAETAGPAVAAERAAADEADEALLALTDHGH